MNSYQMPSDTKEKEKAIGGILTIAQGGWIGAGVVNGLLGFVVALAVTKSFVFSLIILLIGLGIFVPFSFVKIRELTLFHYLKLRIRKERQNPILLNKPTRRGGSSL